MYSRAAELSSSSSMYLDASQGSLMLSLWQQTATAARKPVGGFFSASRASFQARFGQIVNRDLYLLNEDIGAVGFPFQAVQSVSIGFCRLSSAGFQKFVAPKLKLDLPP